MHDNDRVWAVHLQHIPQREIVVWIDEPYRFDDLATVEATIRRYITTAYPTGWRPQSFSIRRRAPARE